MAESAIGLYKTELIRRRGPWRTPEQVEFATLEYIDWFNNRRLHGVIGHVPPAEREATYYAPVSPGTEASCEAAISPDDRPTPPGRTALRRSQRLVSEPNRPNGTDRSSHSVGEPPRPPTGRRSTNDGRITIEIPSHPSGGTEIQDPMSP